MVALVTPPAVFDAKQLKKSMKVSPEEKFSFFIRASRERKEIDYRQSLDL